MPSTTQSFTWRPFEEVPCGPEAALVAASCSFSLATLEMASLHDCSGFAITERQQPEVWRWAVIGKDGSILEEGCEPTQAEAKRAAAEALNLAEDEDSYLSDGDHSIAANGPCGPALPATQRVG
jgi:hypothetical protein